MLLQLESKAVKKGILVEMVSGHRRFSAQVCRSANRPIVAYLRYTFLIQETNLTQKTNASANYLWGNKTGAKFVYEVIANVLLLDK